MAWYYTADEDTTRWLGVPHNKIIVLMSLPLSTYMPILGFLEAKDSVFELHTSMFSHSCHKWPCLKPTYSSRVLFDYAKHFDVIMELSSNLELGCPWMQIKNVVVWSSMSRTSIVSFSLTWANVCNKVLNTWNISNTIYELGEAHINWHLTSLKWPNSLGFTISKLQGCIVVWVIFIWGMQFLYNHVRNSTRDYCASFVIDVNLGLVYMRSQVPSPTRVRKSQHGGNILLLSSTKPLKYDLLSIKTYLDFI